jgi:hypothetical protein
LHHFVRKAENALRYNQVAISAFIDIEDASDNTTFDSIRAAVERRHIELETVDWIIRMLECQIKVGNGASNWLRITRGCLQGVVLSPLLLL